MGEMRNASDAELMARLPADPEALEVLFRRYRRTVLAYGARRCSQPADVADLVAATFLGLLETAARYDPARGELVPWLLGIAHRQLVMARRRAGRDEVLRAQVAGLRTLDDDAIARIEEEIDAARSSPAVEHALAGLSDDHREAVWLVGHDELTPIQAAAVVGVSPALFRMRLSRARRALRASLTDPLPTVPPTTVPPSATPEVSL